MDESSPSSEPNDRKKKKEPNDRKKRKIRNLLIDKGIQLRFTFTSMFIIFLMSVSLGVSIRFQTQKTTKFFASQRNKSTQLFQRQLKDNTTQIETLRGNATKDLEKVLRSATDMLDVQLKDKDPIVREMAQLAKKTLQKDDLKRVARQRKNNVLLLHKRKQNDRELVALRKQQDKETSDLFQEQAIWILLLLGLFGFLMLILIFVFSIRMTHRVVGPIYKMGRYLDAIREEQSIEISGLRKHDLLKDFYEKFLQMYNVLEANKKKDKAALDSILQHCEDGQINEKGLTLLKELISSKEIDTNKETSTNKGISID